MRDVRRGVRIEYIGETGALLRSAPIGLNAAGYAGSFTQDRTGIHWDLPEDVTSHVVLADEAAFAPATTDLPGEWAGLRISLDTTTPVTALLHDHAGRTGREIASRKALSPAASHAVLTVERPSHALGLAIAVTGRGSLAVRRVAAFRPLPDAFATPTQPLGTPAFARLGGLHAHASDAHATIAATGTGLPAIYGKAQRITPEWDLSDLAGDRTAELWLHGLAYVASLVERPIDTDVLAAGRLTARLLLDHTERFPMRRSTTTDMSWNDMAVAMRTEALAWVLHLDAHVGLVPAPQRQVLLGALVSHSHWLASLRDYFGRHNHALFADLALWVAGTALRTSPELAHFAETARSRAHATLQQQFGQDGLHVEHSTAYFFDMASVLGAIAASGLAPAAATPIAAELTHAKRRFIDEMGRMVPLGDTSAAAVDEPPSPPPSCDVFPTGYAVVRTEREHVVHSAAFHSNAHKHADDNAVVFYVDGVPLLADPGNPGYGYGNVDRDWGISTAAHNTLKLVANGTLDGDRPLPYGSGIIGAAESRGRFVTAGRVPATADGAVAHVRIVLLHPGERLLIFDLLEGDDAGRRTRHWLFGVAASAPPGSAGVVSLDGPGGRFTLELGSDVGPPTIDMVHGRNHPRRGWSYPATGAPEPAWSLHAHDGTARTMWADLRYPGVSSQLRIGSSGIEDGRIVVELEGDGGCRITVEAGAISVAAPA